jgi:putative tricarboxylic transport membrane protein
MTMSDERAPQREPDVLDEVQAEVARALDEDRPPAGGPAYQVVGALVALAVGVAGVVLSYGYGLGSPRNPGAGLWPFIISVVIVALSLALLVGGRHLTDSERFTASSVLPVVGLLTFLAFGFLLPVIGFEIPALLLCVVWLRFLGGESWRSTIVVSVVTVAFFYALFLHALSIPLPHLF